jgi:hypothetical protein
MPQLGIEIEILRLTKIDAVPYVPEEPGPYRLDFYYRRLPKQGFSSLREGDSVPAAYVKMRVQRGRLCDGCGCAVRSDRTALGSLRYRRFWPVAPR